MTLVNKTGEKVFILSSPTPLLDEEGEFKGSYEVITDISNIKLIETQLLHSQKMETVGALAAGIAHEINTPLQYIIANAIFLNETTTKLVDLAQSIRNIYADSSLEAPADKLHAIDAMMEAVDIDFVAEEIPAAINDAIEGLNRISSIVLSVKQFAHPGFNNPTPIDTNKEIQNALAIATNEWKPYAEVVTELDEDIPQLLCVASDFNQMILNLVVNARPGLARKVYRHGFQRAHHAVDVS